MLFLSIFSNLSAQTAISLEEIASCDFVEFPPESTAPEPTLCEQSKSVIYDLEIGIGASSGITQSSQLPNGLLFQKNVRIVGNFTVNSFCSFENVVASINANVSINVNGQGTIFNVTNSKLFACQGLWTGIVMNAENQEVSVLEGTSIEDARNAIRSSGVKRSNIIIENSDFNRNVYGVYLLANSNFMANEMPTISQLVNTTFRVSLPINGGVSPVTGIFSQNVLMPLSMNEASNNSNSFQRTGTGILSIGANTELYVYGSGFGNMSTAGINAVSSNLLFMRSCNFNECRRGISFRNAEELEILACNFRFDAPASFNREHIFIENPRAQNSFLIDETHFHVNGVNTAGAATCFYVKPGAVIPVAGLLQRSSFNLYNPSQDGEDALHKASTGLKIVGNLFLQNNLIEISANDIFVNPGLPYRNIGVEVEGGIERHRLFITNNVFHCNGRGVIMDGGTIPIQGEGTDLTDLHFATQNGDKGWGIEINGTEGLNICSNNMYQNSLNASYRFNGQCMSTNFALNYTVASNFSILNNLFIIENEGVISAQNTHGNQWLPISVGGVISRPRVWNANSNVSIVQLSKFSVTEPQSVFNAATQTYSLLSVSHPDRVVPDDFPNEDVFFDSEGIGLTDNCVNLLALSNPDEADIAVATGVTDNLFQGAAVGWDAQLYLYRKLNLIAGYAQQHPAFGAFINAKTNSNIGHFYRFDRDINLAMIAPVVLQANLDNLHADIEQNRAALLSLSSATSSATLMNDLSLMIQNKANLEQQYIQERNQKLQAALQHLALVTPTTVYEYNKKRVSELMVFQTLNPESDWTDAQSQELKSIAQQCMEDGGKIVQTARGLLSQCDYDKIRPQVLNCRKAPQDRSVPTNTDGNDSKEVLVAPNPAMDIVQIQLSKRADLLVYSVTGQLMLQQKAQKGSNVVPVNKFIPGLYFLHFRFEDGTSTTKKLIIQH